MVRGAWMVAAMVLLGCDDGALQQSEDPASACDCPVEWQVDNLAICGQTARQVGKVSLPPLVYSTRVDPNGRPYCDNATTKFPQPVPATNWSAQRISSPCAGEGRLCFALKAGQSDAPTDADCVLASQCSEFTYTGDGAPLELPALGPWVATDESCLAKYEAGGGYLEFRVEDAEIGCTAEGESVPVKRIQTCKLACATNPGLAECQECASLSLDGML